MTTVAAQAMPVDYAVEDALMRSIRIPPRPSLLVDLQRELAHADPSPRRIARIIGNDVGMSGALLKLANSPYFGALRKAKSVEQAINFLGLNQFAALLTGLLARAAIDGNESDLSTFWDVSARRAQALVFTSRKLRIAPPDIAHTFGLFCDIGVPLLMNRFADYKTTLTRPATTPNASSRSSRTSAIAPTTPPSAACWRATGACRRTSRGRFCTTTITACSTTTPPTTPCARWWRCRCWPKKASSAIRATASRWSGKKAANAPAATSACRPTRPPTCSTNCTKPSTPNTDQTDDRAAAPSAASFRPKKKPCQKINAPCRANPPTLRNSKTSRPRRRCARWRSTWPSRRTASNKAPSCAPRMPSSTS